MNLKTRIALSIHAFYLDVFEDIVKSIPASFPYFDIYVTCPTENEGGVRRILDTHGTQASVLVCPNRGMDVVPFIESVRQFELFRYVAVVKLHTKNNKDVKGAAILDEIVSRILSDDATLFQLRELFCSRAEIGIAGPEYLFKNVDFMMYNNRWLCTAILRELDVGYKAGIGFFAGTMFWIRGSLLEHLAARLPRLLELYDRVPSVAQTGSDGSMAHAIERIWCGLSDDPGMKVALVYPQDRSGRGNIVRVASQPSAIRDPMRRLAVSDLITILPGSSSAASLISKSDLFDEEYYLARSNGVHSPGMDPALHYVRYGEPLGIPPSPRFSPAYYGYVRQDVRNAGVSLLAHYLNFGRRERMIANPTREDWFSAAQRNGIWDSGYYEQKFPHSITAYGGADKHFRRVGRHLMAPTSRNFDPSTLPVLAKPDGARDSLVRYLEDYRIDESNRYHELARLVQNNDFVTLRQAVKEIVERYGATAPIQIANALYYVCVGDVAAAGRELEAFWHDLEGEMTQRRHINRLTSYLRKLKPSTETWPKPTCIERCSNERVCVYTTLFGDIDELPPILSKERGVDYVCFTDRQRTTPGWEFRISSPQFSSANLSAKIFKILPHRYLQKYEYSMFVDANTIIAGRLKQFIVNYLRERDFAMWTHPEREDPYVEMCAIVEAERHAPAKLVAQMIDYQKNGLPAGSEMYEASFIWRKHGQPHIIQFMEEWWNEILVHSERDQLSLCYLAWKTGLEPAKIDGRFGTSRSNTVFFKVPHSKKGHRPKHHVGYIDSNIGHHKEKDLHIIYSEKHIMTGSNVLRGQQFFDMFRKALSRNVVYSQNDNISNKIAIATKGFVAEKGADGVRALKERGNIVLLDLVDAKPSSEIVEVADGLIASSIQAMKQYKMSWVDKPCFHITHHVDLRLEGRKQKVDGIKIGYFGELLNTIIDDQLSDLVDFTHVDTSRFDLGWMNKMKEYNCHYAVRKTRTIDGHKPFLKGFIAAKYKSNIIIQRDAGDAEYYLGTDYPYLLESNASLNDIIEMVRFVNESYGGPEWRSGLIAMRDIRRRSSNDFVISEIRDMLKQISNW